MELLQTTIPVGAAEPFWVYHAGDTHLTLADNRDDERKMRLSKKRENHFPQALSMLEEIQSLCRENQRMLVHTGDLIDFVSEQNLEAVRQFTDGVDCFMAAGNHEYSLYVGEAKEDADYRRQSEERVQAVFHNNIRFASRVEHGVNFVALDNGYYLVEPWQLERLKAEAEKGLPMVLCLHTPLYSEELYEFLLDKEGRDTPAYLMAVPPEKMSHYTPERYEQQKADATTKEAYDFILQTDCIKALLVGHVHCPFEFPLENKMQYGVGCTQVRAIQFT